MPPRKQAKRGIASGATRSSRRLSNNSPEREGSPPVQEDHDIEHEDDDRDDEMDRSSPISTHRSSQIEPTPAPTPAELALRIKELENEVLRKELQLLQNQAKPVATTERSYKMIDPEKYCGGAEELETFLAALRTRFNAHSQLFPNDTV
jgi:hypothetical protein